MANQKQGSEPAKGELSALLHLALPIALGQWTQMAMHTIDTAMVGRLGVESVAASSLGSIATAPFFLGIGAVGAALPPLVAHALAARDRSGAARLLRHGRACAWVLSLASIWVFSVLAWWIPVSGQPAAVVAEARNYGLIVIWSMVPVMLLQNLRGWAEAHGRAWLPMGNIAVGLLVNVGANAVLIYGWGPVPRLGLAGAAIGTCIARLVMLGHFMWVIRTQEALTPVARGAATGAWSREIFSRYLKLGGTTAVATLLVVGCGMVLVVWAARMGPEVLAAHEIARQMWLLSYVLPFGWSMAVALRTAHWRGTGDRAKLRHCASVSLWGGLLVGLVLGGSLWWGRSWWPLLFLGADDAGSPTAELASRILVLVALMMLCEGLFLTAVGICRGFARMVPVAVAYLGSYWVVGLLAANWLGQPERGGLIGLWVGFAGGVALGTVGMVGYAWSQVRRAQG